jgi:aspartate aminotransferase-like enzyme/predicted N-acetyltransferase YhbS
LRTLGEKHDYFFKIATQEHEFEQIHQLNYQTFSMEIPQHQRNEQEKLVDPFHDQNTYIICIKENKLIGMIAVRESRPFSLDRKIGVVEESLPITAYRLCEIRLLAVKKEFRNGRVFIGLAQFLAEYCLKKGYDAAVISGTVRELKLYRQMGFQPFASLTGTDEASFQPMYLTKTTFEESLAGRILQPVLSFLPGPVPLTEKVRESLRSSPISHRSYFFKEKMAHARKMLCELVNSQHVQILLGSGTLANDVIAAQLSLEKGTGIILENGEFGRRLVEQASRLGLHFHVLKKEWGHVFTKEEIVANLTDETSWIWAVHSETSTGVLNNLEVLKEISRENQLKLCLDCISSIGAVQLDLEDVFLASGVSGKALRAFTGLSFVFHHHKVSATSNLPKYLDLGIYMEQDSIPFSHSSNLLEPLLVALESVSENTYQKMKETHQYLKHYLTQLGFHLISIEEPSPIIITIELPNTISSSTIGELLFYHGYQLHFESEYLQKRNWIQIACIGDYEKADLEKMIKLLKHVVDYERMNTPDKINLTLYDQMW